MWYLVTDGVILVQRKGILDLIGRAEVNWFRGVRMHCVIVYTAEYKKSYFSSNCLWLSMIWYDIGWLYMDFRNGPHGIWQYSRTLGIITMEQRKLCCLRGTYCDNKTNPFDLFSQVVSPMRGKIFHRIFAMAEPSTKHWKRLWLWKYRSSILFHSKCIFLYYPFKSTVKKIGHHKNILDVTICYNFTASLREIYKRSFLYKGSSLWNQLPSCLKESISIIDFKRNYKLLYGWRLS